MAALEGLGQATILLGTSEFDQKTRQELQTLGFLAFYKGTLGDIYGLSGASLHDPCAVAALIDPNLIAFEPMHVAVELKGEYTYGMTVCDHRHLLGIGEDIKAIGKRKGEPPNAEVALHIDKAGFFNLLTETLALYP